MQPSLLQMRERMKYSREQVAAQIGVSVNSIRNWETHTEDARRMSFEKAVKLADCFGVSIEYIWKVCSK